jgi:ElaB/YqjD/DUF883 family membrane-anchored ribosome-binding protein
VDEITVTRVEIEQTRTEMSGTIDAIKEKLSPAHLMQEAKDSVKETTSNLAHEAIDKAKDTVSGAVESARDAVGGVVDSARQAVAPAVESARQVVGPAVDTARDTGSYIMDMIKQNPMPAALIGLGLGWLYMNQRNQSRQDSMARRYDRPYNQEDWREWSDVAPAGASREARRGASFQSSGSEQPSNGGLHAATAAVGDKLQDVQQQASQALQGVQQQASQIGARAQQSVGQMTDSAQRLMWENPLAAGAIALALGAGIGLAIPESPQENRMMGEARDQLVDRAQQTAQQLGQKVQAAAGDALDAAKDQASRAMG